MLAWLARVKFRHYIAGLSIIALLFMFYGMALRAIFSLNMESEGFAIIEDPYLYQVIRFSLGQAFLSALLSVTFGFLLARSLFYQRFWGKSGLLRLLSLTFVLPNLVAIFGLLGIYGYTGWLKQGLAFLGITWQFNFYGLTGILVAHLFFNIPLACRMLLQSLQAIPYQQRQLAAQLNIRGWKFIYLIELPYLRQQFLAAFALIFMLCFTSFAIVLTLGGGPKYTTLEVAIYQAVLFEFDFSKAGLLALLQCLICLVLFAASQYLTQFSVSQIQSKETWFATQSRLVRLYQLCLIGFMMLFILTPLLHIIFSAFSSGKIISLWQNPMLWKALRYSLSIAPLSALLSVLFALGLLIFARQLHWQHYRLLANTMLNIGMMILAIPTLVLATGLFLLFQSINVSTITLFGVVVICNALAALPFVLRILAEPMYRNMEYYEKLCQALGIRGWQRFRWIEWPQLHVPLKYAFALASCLSLGDFTAIALLGSQDFTSLPHLLYQQLGSYRTQEASVTALILLVFCIGIFVLIEGNKKGKSHD